MPSFMENINTIGSAIYGKEMRPAIKEALLQSMNLVTGLDSEIDKLSKKVDDLSGSGGDDGGDPDSPSIGAGTAGYCYQTLYAIVNDEEIAGEAIEV